MSTNSRYDICNFLAVCLCHLSFGKIPRPTEKPESLISTPLFSVKGDLGVYSVASCAANAEKSENKKANDINLRVKKRIIHLALPYKLDFFFWTPIALNDLSLKMCCKFLTFVILGLFVICVFGMNQRESESYFSSQETEIVTVLVWALSSKGSG